MKRDKDSLMVTWMICMFVIFTMMAFSQHEPAPMTMDSGTYMTINKHPAGTQIEVLNLSFVYDQTLVDQASSNISPMAVTPDLPHYVAIGGTAINPNCDDPYIAACRIDISAYCLLGVCNVAIAVPVDTWRTIWCFYDGQAHNLKMRDDDLVPYTGWEPTDGYMRIHVPLWSDPWEYYNHILSQIRQQYFEDLWNPGRSIVPAKPPRFF